MLRTLVNIRCTSEPDGEVLEQEDMYPGKFITFWVQPDGRIIRGWKGETEGAKGIRFEVAELKVYAENSDDIDLITSQTIVFDTHVSPEMEEDCVRSEGQGVGSPERDGGDCGGLRQDPSGSGQSDRGAGSHGLRHGRAHARDREGLKEGIMRLFRSEAMNAHEHLSMRGLSLLCQEIWGPSSSPHFWHTEVEALDGRTPFQAVIDGDNQKVYEYLCSQMEVNA